MKELYYSRRALTQRRSCPMKTLHTLVFLFVSLFIINVQSSQPHFGISSHHLPDLPLAATTSKIPKQNPTVDPTDSISDSETAQSVEEWRKSLPLQLRSKKGAPLHRIVLEPHGINGRKVTIYLLGTSHVSRESCNDAKLLMEHVLPDVLFVELCSRRAGMLLSPPPDPSDKIKKEKTFDEKGMPVAQRSLQSSAVLFAKIQNDYARKLNVTIGAEFREAFRSALNQQCDYWRIQRYNELWQNGYSQSEILDVTDANFQTHHSRGVRPCHIVLGDRPVHITLTRAWESLRLFGKVKLVIALIWSSICQPSEIELREWMDSILNDRTGKNDLLTKSMEDLGKTFPSLKKVIIDERDEFMVAKLRQVADMMQSPAMGMGASERAENENVVVAVVGAGHCPGMVERLRNTNGGTGNRQVPASPPAALLPALVETKKMKMKNNDEVSSLVTDVIQFDYSYAIQKNFFDLKKL